LRTSRTPRASPAPLSWPSLAGSGNSAGPLGVDSSGEEFLAHEDARDWLIGLLENTELGARLFDPQHGHMMRAIPLSRLSRFPGAPFSEAMLEEAVKRFSKEVAANT